MDIKNIEYFLAVYETRNFTKAADKLHRTQQGISKAIAQLEQEFGVSLFQRDRSKLVPTEFGELFYAQTSHLMEEYQRTMDILTHAVLRPATLSIGIGANVTSVINIQTLTASFQKMYPDIKIKTMDLTDMECEHLLTTHEIDIAFSMGPFQSSTLQPYFLTSETVFALLSDRHPLASHGIISLEELSREPLITADTQNKGYLYTRAMLQHINGSLNIIFCSSDPLTDMQLVQKELGIMLFPEHLLSLFEGSDAVCIRPIEGNPQRNLYVVSETTTLKQPSAKTFINYIQEQFRPPAL
jgi:DNA-binding transcriptional LysR family regulator